MTGTSTVKKYEGGARGLSLVIPAYNEADVIYETVMESARALEGLGLDYEIVVVDDGSIDGSAREIERAAREIGSLVVVVLPENEGKGNAMKRGFQASTRELVCFLDADLDLHPSQVGNLLEVLEATGADVVIGSKRHPESLLEYPRQRRVYSSVYYFFIRALFRLPIHDTQTGIKLFRREVLAHTFPRLIIKCFALDLELLVVAHSLGYKVAEAPVEIKFHRPMGRITWPDIRGIVIDTMGIFYRMHVLGYYGSPLKPAIDREPKVSIVVPSRGLDPMTAECLRRCQELNYTNFDIKFIPDGHEDVDLAPAGSRVIVSGPVGPAHKRNLGVEDSDAEIIAFIDADAWPDYDWLRSAVPYFEEEDVAAVGGAAVTPASDSRRQMASGVVYGSMLVSGSTTYRYKFHAFRQVDDLPTCNLLVRKADFDAVGGFDLEFWPGEDTVLCLKLVRDLGKRILYAPNCFVNHHRRALMRPHLRQVYSYSVHRGFFSRKFPENSRRLQYFVPSLLILWLVAGLVAGLLYTPLLYTYLSILGLYLLLVLVSSLKSLDLLTNLLIFPGIIATHVTYGIGFMRGLLSRKMKEQS
jgi:cellulose synthase/poly-beta-1,6-N-acetylglucosamine synthase-like glycosyltransferase